MGFITLVAAKAPKRKRKMQLFFRMTQTTLMKKKKKKNPRMKTQMMRVLATSGPLNSTGQCSMP